MSISDHDLIKYCNDENLKAVGNILLEISVSSLIDIISDLSKVKYYCIQCIKGAKYINEETVYKVIQAALIILVKNVIEDINSASLIVFLQHEMEILSSDNILCIFTDMCDHIENYKIMTPLVCDILLKLMSFIEVKTFVTFKGKKFPLGVEVVQHMITHLCCQNWHKENIIYLSKMFTSGNFKSQEHTIIVKKMASLLDDIDSTDLPVFVYQMILFSMKGSKFKIVFDNLILYFNKLNINNDSSKSTLLDDVVEKQHDKDLCDKLGTVLYHILIALRSNQEVGNEIVKLSSAWPSSSLLHTFHLTLLLTVASLERYSESVHLLLRKSIESELRQHHMFINSAWARQMLTTRRVDLVESELFVALGLSLKSDWREVVQSFINLGFFLVESSAVAKRPSKVANVSDGTVTAAAKDDLCQVGSRVLLTIFKSPTYRDDLIERVLIAATIPGTTDAVGNKAMAELLRNMGCAAPLALLQQQRRVRDALEVIPQLPPLHAASLIRALLPAIRSSAPLRDSLFIVLRKTLVGRSSCARYNAAQGLLLLLRNCRLRTVFAASQSSQSCGSSQASSQAVSSSQMHLSVQVHSQEAVVGSTAAEVVCAALCSEALALLQRSLLQSQQIDVRQLIYTSLPDVLTDNPLLCADILLLLRSQLGLYFSDTEDMHAMPPINLAAALTTKTGSQASLLEPLDLLLISLQRVLSFAKRILLSSDRTHFNYLDEEEESSEQFRLLVERVEQLLLALIRGLASTELEDWQLDQSSDFSATTSAGRRNRVLAPLLLGMLDTAFNYCGLAELLLLQTNLMELAFKLLIQRDRLLHVLKDKTKGVAETGSLVKNRLVLPSATDPGRGVSLDALCTLLDRCLNPTNKDIEATTVDERTSLAILVLQLATGRVHTLATNGNLSRAAEQASKPSRHRALFVVEDVEVKAMSQLLQLAINFYHRSLEKFAADGENTVPQAVSRQIRPVMIAALQVIAITLEKAEEADWISQMINEVVLVPLLRDNGNTSTETQLSILVRLIKEWTERVFSDQSESGVSNEALKTTVRDLITLLPLLVRLCRRHAGKRPEKMEPLQVWLTYLVRKRYLEESNTTRVLMLQFLSLTAQTVASPDTVLRQVIVSARRHLGQVDQNAEVDSDVEADQMACVSQRSASTVLSLLIAHCGTLLSEAEWGVLQLRSVAQMQQELDARDAERKLCQHLAGVSRALHELVSTAAAPGPQTDALIGILSRFYILMAQLAKFYLEQMRSTAATATTTTDQ